MKVPTQFYSTPQWKEALKAEAEARGQSLSTFIIKAVDKELNQ